MPGQAGLLGRFTLTIWVSLFFLVLVAVSASIAGYVIHRNLVEFQGYHEKIARQSVNSVASEMRILLGEIRRASRLFVDDNQDLLWQLSQNPGDAVTFDRISGILRHHFPEYSTFTLTSLEGDLLYDDFGENIGELCRTNIRNTIQDDHLSSIIVHPGPVDYHFDIMVPWNYQGKKRGLFFKSYQLNVIARLLEVGQMGDHRLYLLRRDDPTLIEISAEGGRDRLEGLRPIRLEPDEQQRILNSLEIEGTGWNLVDIIRPEVFSDYRRNMERPLVGAVAMILFLSILTVWAVGREERRRRAAEQQLQRHAGDLEDKVRERTAELTLLNRDLEDEIQRRDRAEALQRIFGRAADQSREIIFITDVNGVIEYVNRAFEQSTGYPAEEAVGQPVRLLKSGMMDDSTYRDLWETILRKERYTHIVTNRTRDERLVYWDETITPLLDDNGEIQHFISTSRDITEDRLNQEKMLYLTERDLLTGLYNLSHFEQLVNQVLAERGDTTLFALMQVEIGNYARLYEGLGRLNSERLVLELSRRLRGVAREHDLLARSAPGSFLLYGSGLHDADETASLAERVMLAWRKPWEFEDVRIEVTPNIGVSLYPGDGAHFDDLAKGAYAATRKVAAAGGNGVAFYQSGMSEQAAERIRMEQQLREALEDEAIQAWFQPKVDLRNGRVRGFEALARWPRKPPAPLVPPSVFIPLLEEMGQIGQLCMQTVRTSCHLLRELRTPADQWSIAINLSAEQFGDKCLVGRMREVLASCNLPPDALEFEVTESLLIGDFDHALQTLEGLHGLGCQISLDDFGTGYSSLQYLKVLPFDSLKIDKSFIDGVHLQERDRVFVETMINMAHNLGKRAIAEGVEQITQLQTLRELGCDEVQGYLISRPIPPDQLGDWLAQYDFFDQMRRVGLSE